jgi:hypothetical protein
MQAMQDAEAGPIAALLRKLLWNMQLLSCQFFNDSRNNQQDATL